VSAQKRTDCGAFEAKRYRGPYVADPCDKCGVDYLSHARAIPAEQKDPAVIHRQE